MRTRAVKPVFSRAQVERTYVPAMRKRLAQSFEEQRKAVLAKLAALPPRSRASLADIFDEETLSKKMRARLLKLDVKLFEESAQLTLTGIGTDKDFIFTTEVMKEIRKHNADYVTQVNETTKRRLAAALAEGVEEGESTEKIAERLDAVFAERKRNTMTIARTEVGTGAIRASIEAVKQSGSKRRKQWIATSDNLTRDDHADMNGVVVDLDEQFDVGGYKAEGPCDANLPAEQRINCRCDLAYPRAE